MYSIKLALLYLTLLILVESSAFYFIKKYSIENTKKYYIIFSIILYASLPIILYLALLNEEGLATTNIMWNIASIIYGILIGIVLFNETFTQRQKIGATIGLIGLILMMFYK